MLVRRGFSLAEMVVALGLLAAASLVVIGVFTSGLSYMGQTEQHTVAHEISRELLERVRAGGGYTALPAGPRVFDGREGQAPDGAFPPSPYPGVVLEGQSYDMVVRVADHPTLVGVRAVRVEVYWGKTGRTVVETAFGG